MAENAAQGDELPGVVAVGADEDGASVLRLIGEVDYAVVAAYEQTVSLATAGCPISIIDASAATFLDCGALAFLIRTTAATCRADGKPLLRLPPRALTLILELTATDHLFSIESTRLATDAL